MDNQKKESMKTAYFHLPGLFEFYELYRIFLPLFYEKREYFYENVAIGSIYGSPQDCLWGGGRVENGENNPEEVIALLRRYHISARLTFSNSMLTKEHLSDYKCNALCELFAKQKDMQNGVIVHSDLLLAYLREKYPMLTFVSSTTKVLTDKEELFDEIRRTEFQYVVPDFRWNNRFEILKELSQDEKRKLEFLCNECCYVGCKERKLCYEDVSRKNLGVSGAEHVCKAPEAGDGYRFSKAMNSPSFISREAIEKSYLPEGITNFKIEGRGLGSAMVLEFLLYYLVKPEYQIHVREHIYLDAMLDLF